MVKNVNKTISISFVKEINKINLDVNYSYSNDNPPMSVHVRGNSSIGGGVSYLLSRVYKENGNFDDTPTNVAPFDKPFNDELKAFILELYKNYKTPETL